MIKKIFRDNFLPLMLLLVLPMVNLSCNFATALHPHSLSWERSDKSIFTALKKTSIIMVKNGEAYCSGNVISSTAKATLILSCAHCFRGKKKTYIVDHRGRRYLATVVAKHAYWDLALLKTVPTGLPSLQLHPTIPDQYSTVYNIGHPMGLTFTASKGHLIGVRTNRILPPLYQFSAVIYFGSSGSSVVDHKLQLIGVASRVFISEHSFALAIPITTIRQFLQGISDGKYLLK